MGDVDFVQLAPQVGLHLLGKPTKQSSTEYRWGTNGSWCLNLETGLFFSFELDEGGGVIWLIDHFNQNRNDILNMYGSGFKDTITLETKSYKQYTQEQMRSLANEAEVLLKYTDAFVVMRFKEGHSIRQKYAPFCKVNNVWQLKRPEGLMPIYFKDGEGPVIISEGEKATIGANKLYDGPTATWHGGVHSWKKANWEPLFGKEIIIWPDNDEAGFKCAEELSEYLTDNKCIVQIAKIPESFNTKDDLYDAYSRNDYDKDSFKEYISTSISKPKKPSLVLRKISDLITNIPEPEWIIEDIMEKDSVIDIYGAPKSGKSFVAIDMALCSSLGIPWHTHKTEQTPIIYLAGEGQRGIARRVQAWEHYYGHNLLDAQMFVSDRGVRFLDEKDHQNLIDHIRQVADEFGDIGCLYVDTLARNFGAGNENSTEDMNKFIERVDHLKSEFSCCIALIHHTGHSSSGRARGSSVLPAAVDAEFAVKRPKDEGEEMRVEFTQTLIKDGKPMNPKFFKFREIDLINYPGMTSGVLVKTEYDDFKEKDFKIDETIIAIAEIQAEKAEADNVDPISIWVTQTDVIRKQQDLKESTVKQRLKRLKDDNKIYYEKGKGYQAKKYDDIN
jgi:5S rRNA maturation endonuclease (ribonuclease M5)